jgi:hypothetical protein
LLGRVAIWRRRFEKGGFSPGLGLSVSNTASLSLDHPSQSSPNSLLGFPSGLVPSVGCPTSHMKQLPSIMRIGDGTTRPSERVKPAEGERDTIET